jgi:hypothetical protein
MVFLLCRIHYLIKLSLIEVFRIDKDLNDIVIEVYYAVL